MKSIKNTLNSGEGYIILHDLLPNSVIHPLVEKISEFGMLRASTKSLQYAEKDNIQLLNDIAVYWSKTLINEPEIKIINSFLHDDVKNVSDTLQLYSADFVTIKENTEY